MGFRNLWILRRWTWVLAAAVLLLPLIATAQQSPLGPFQTEGGGVSTQAGQPINKCTASVNDTGVLFKGLNKCLACGDCSLCDMFAVVKNATDLILSLTGAVALGFLLWNAFRLIMARGNAEHIKAGREGVWKIAVGLFFLLLAWELVAIVFAVASGGQAHFPPWEGLTCPA